MLFYVKEKPLLTLWYKKAKMDFSNGMAYNEVMKLDYTCVLGGTSIQKNFVIISKEMPHATPLKKP